MTLSSNHPSAGGASGSRYIPSEELQEQQVRPWNFGDMDGMGFVPMGAAVPPPPAPKKKKPTHQAPAPEAEPAPEPIVAGIPEEQVQQMLAEAREQAHAEAMQQAQAQLDELVAQHDAAWQEKFDAYVAEIGAPVAAQLSGVLAQAQSGIRGLQQSMAPQLLQLACDIARQVVRQELRTNPQSLLPVVREALDMLGAETKPAIVRIHPDDWAHLERHLKAAVPSPKVEWLSDAGVPPGGCKVEVAGSVVDGSIERRWQRAVAALGLVSTWYEAPAAAAHNPAESTPRSTHSAVFAEVEAFSAPTPASAGVSDDSPAA